MGVFEHFDCLACVDQIRCMVVIHTSGSTKQCDARPLSESNFPCSQGLLFRSDPRTSGTQRSGLQRVWTRSVRQFAAGMSTSQRAVFMKKSNTSSGTATLQRPSPLEASTDANCFGALPRRRSAETTSARLGWCRRRCRRTFSFLRETLPQSARDSPTRAAPPASLSIRRNRF